MNTSPKSNQKLALSLLAIVVGMVMLTYAAVPLYQMFCKLTGFAGTPQKVATPPSHILDRTITVSFNADLDANLPWRFVPLQREVSVKIGEQMLVAFEAENMSDNPVTGVATFNVTPQEVGGYFDKMQCFCFEKQTLAPHQVVKMPVSFFIDPEIVNDPNFADVKNITLSYTFFNQQSANHIKTLE